MPSETGNKQSKRMDKISVSVIVAIFNAEKTLPRLLDSLCSQTMHDFEVLLLDDGSTDGSGAICDRYADLDRRFKAFHKANEGIGATRQFGIEHASGEYTIHADADDWVEPDYLELLYQTALLTGVDMVMSDYFEEQGGKTVYCKQKPSQETDLLHDLFYNLYGGPWNKLIKHSVYTERNIRYDLDLNYGEDKIFNMRLAMTGISVSYVPKALYHYDTGVNPDSAIHGYSVEKIRKREQYVQALRKLLPDSYELDIDNRHLDVVYMAILSKAFTKQVFKEKFSFLSRVKWRNYQDKAFSIKLIIWTSLNLSYGFALFLSYIKKTKRQLKR